MEKIDAKTEIKVSYFFIRNQSTTFLEMYENNLKY